MASRKTWKRMCVMAIASGMVVACGGEDEFAEAPLPPDTASTVGPAIPIPGDTLGVALDTAPPTVPAPATPAPATPAPATPAPAPAAAAGNVAEGGQIFASSGLCFACHGAGGIGGALAPNLTDGTWIWFTTRPTVDQLVTLIKTGVATPKVHPAPMPAMGGASLTDAQVRSVAAYVRSLSGA